MDSNNTTSQSQQQIYPHQNGVIMHAIDEQTDERDTARMLPRRQLQQLGAANGQLTPSSSSDSVSSQQHRGDLQVFVVRHGITCSTFHLV